MVYQLVFCLICVVNFRSVTYDENAFSNWVQMGSAPAFDASLRLYNAVKKLGFTIILITGRDECHINITNQISRTPVTPVGNDTS